MGWLSNLGKVALVASPYIAAPFTGGASLALTGAANAAEQKWAAHDAKKNAEKGIAPSKFDKYLGMGANIAGLASGVGALGSLGGAASAANTAVKAGKAATILNNVGKYGKLGTDVAGEIMARNNGGGQPVSGQGLGPTDPQIAMTNRQPQQSDQAMPRDPARGLFGPNFGADQNNPNLALAINQGRMQSRFRNAY